MDYPPPLNIILCLNINWLYFICSGNDSIIT
jgi:hypothetical protein